MAIENDAPNVSAAFGYTAEGIAKKKTVVGGQSAMDFLSDEDSLKSLRKKMMQEDGIFIDGDERLIGLGNLGIVSRLATKRNEGEQAHEVPGAIVRLEYLSPVLHDIVLHPAFSKTYDETMMNQEAYKIFIVPNAPDLPDMPVTKEDILNTFRVLKAAHLEHTFWDMEVSAFAYLKNPEGEIIRYPNTPETPVEFRGRPIAFIRDLNAMDQATRGAHEHGDEGTSVHTNVRQWFAQEFPDMVEIKEGETVLKKEALKPAPAECVEACKQQYAVTARLGEILQEHGITPNVIPTPPALQSAAAMRAVGTTPSHESARG